MPAGCPSGGRVNAPCCCCWGRIGGRAAPTGTSPCMCRGRPTPCRGPPTGRTAPACLPPCCCKPGLGAGLPAGPTNPGLAPLPPVAAGRMGAPPPGGPNLPFTGRGPLAGPPPGAPKRPAGGCAGPLLPLRPNPATHKASANVSLMCWCAEPQEVQMQARCRYRTIMTTFSLQGRSVQVPLYHMQRKCGPMSHASEMIWIMMSFCSFPAQTEDRAACRRTSAAAVDTTLAAHSSPIAAAAPLPAAVPLTLRRWRCIARRREPRALAHWPRLRSALCAEAAARSACWRLDTRLAHELVRRDKRDHQGPRGSCQLYALQRTERSISGVGARERGVQIRQRLRRRLRRLGDIVTTLTAGIHCNAFADAARAERIERRLRVRLVREFLWQIRHVQHPRPRVCHERGAAELGAGQLCCWDGRCVLDTLELRRCGLDARGDGEATHGHDRCRCVHWVVVRRIGDGGRLRVLEAAPPLQLTLCGHRCERLPRMSQTLTASAMAASRAAV